MSDAVEIRERKVEANGLRFHVLEAGEGDRLALCLHGFPQTAYSWRNQIPVLVRQGYRVWAPNQRGYGGSDKPPHWRDYAVENLMDDAGALIDASGARSTLLLGHDWGAIVAWFFAMRRVRPLERLVIANVPHPGAARKNAGLRQLARSWYMFFFQLPRLPEYMLTRKHGAGLAEMFRRSSAPGTFSDEALAVYTRAALEPGAATGMIHWYRALLRGGARRQQRLGTPVIETPTLMLWGEDDLALTKGLTYGTEKFVPNLTLRYLPGVSHWCIEEAAPTVNAMLEAWLEDRPVPEAVAP